mmetsp:Transcript_122889/g.309251  ORF Transcript_122889/g.309251 Transcript_122889/m.309251 type:complete len:314 (+) Transcript_122889:64-1005(+)
MMLGVNAADQFPCSPSFFGTRRRQCDMLDIPPRQSGIEKVFFFPDDLLKRPQLDDLGNVAASCSFHKMCSTDSCASTCLPTSAQPSLRDFDQGDEDLSSRPLQPLIPEELEQCLDDVAAAAVASPAMGGSDCATCRLVAIGAGSGEFRRISGCPDFWKLCDLDALDDVDDIPRPPRSSSSESIGSPCAQPSAQPSLRGFGELPSGHLRLPIAAAFEQNLEYETAAVAAAAVAGDNACAIHVEATAEAGLGQLRRTSKCYDFWDLCDLDLVDGVPRPALELGCVVGDEDQPAWRPMLRRIPRVHNFADLFHTEA